LGWRNSVAVWKKTQPNAAPKVNENEQKCLVGRFSNKSPILEFFAVLSGIELCQSASHAPKQRKSARELDWEAVNLMLPHNYNLILLTN
jgi:hypothetical protein